MFEAPPERPYSPDLLESELRRAGLRYVALRVAQILYLLVLGLLWVFIDRLAWTYRRGETVEDRQHRRATWLLDQIAGLGPAFVKLAQGLAARPDLLPLPYLDVLSRLYDRLPAFPDEVAFSVIREELGWKPETLFQSIEAAPFAAASLGQVYRAVTHDGREVAVKVQRPGLERTISVDLALLRRLVTWVERTAGSDRRQLWVSILDEFGAKLFEELDYAHEARSALRFRANVSGLAGVYVPEVYSELSSRRVLTTELIEGIKITDRQALQEAGIDIQALLGRGVRASLKQVLEDGFFHADPHPGNLLVRPGDGTLMFVDFGMMGVIHSAQRERMVELFVDALSRRTDRLQENLAALGCLRADARWDEIVPLADQLRRALFGDRERRHSFAEVARAFAPLLYGYEFRIPADFALIARALMTLEGICRLLDPGFDTFSVSAPYAARILLCSPNPGLRERLMAELVTADGRVDWTRLKQLASLASQVSRPGLGMDGFLGPALEILLSPEGAKLRRALVAEIALPASTAQRAEALSALLTSDPAMSAEPILDRLVAFLLSPEGTETREQLLASIRVGWSGRVSVDSVSALLRGTRSLHPVFRTSSVLGAVARYLASEHGRPARAALLRSASEWLIGQILDLMGPAARPSHQARAETLILLQPIPTGSG